MSGVVYLVGAGPGAPDLISVRGQRILRQADVIVCDNLLPRSFLDQTGIAPRCRDVYWRGDGAGAMSQQDINRILCTEAGKGRVVVRLKTGDPLVLGRAGEEIAALQEHGIPWAVVPGVSSCTAAPASAGLMLTDRGSSRSFAVTSAVCAGGKPNERYPEADSLVLLMGVKSLESIVERLLENRWPPDTPVTIIERATLAFECSVSAPLSHIAGVARSARITPPSVVLVGRAADVTDGLQRPAVLFTGLDPAGFLCLGRLLHWPALSVVRNPEFQAQYPAAFAQLKQDRCDTVVFSSKPGVMLFFQAMGNEGLDARLFGRARVVAAGQGTAHALLECGIRADFVCVEDAAREIPDALSATELGKVLLLKTGQKRAHLEDALENAGGRIHPLVTHELQPHPSLGEPLPAHHIIYFVSPSGVDAYQRAYGNSAFEKEVQCIGPATRAALNALGVEAAIVNPYA